MPSATHPGSAWISASIVTLFMAMSLVMPSSATAQAVSATRSDACGTKIRKVLPLLGTWSCTFVDSFSGTSVDLAKWNFQDTAISGFFLGRSCFKSGQNSQVADGTLQLTVTKTATPFVCKSPYGEFETQYLGADINTWGKFNQTYGRFEARIKFPGYTQAGYHGGWWMNPQDHVYGAWPLSGEIDVAEWWSSTPDHAYPSLHYAGSTIDDTGFNCTIGAADTFHTYTLEWTPADMKFLYDGKVCFTRSLTPTLLVPSLPFDQRFALSLTFGEGSPVAPSTATTPFPATMVVDYVKVWK